MNIKQIVNLASFYAKKVKNGEFETNRAKQEIKSANQNSFTRLKNNQKAEYSEQIKPQSRLNGLRGMYLAEYGRSMVEMLGVLAVIGVLSVAGIMGYRYAMTKYIANETINEVNLRARDISFDMEAMIENNYNGDIEMKMGPITRMGYPITARTSPQYIDYFEIFVKEVPTEVCKELLRMPWQVPYSIFVGVEEFEASIDICEQAERVELAYEFYKDMSLKDEIDEDNRHEVNRCNNENDCKCGYCEDGLCKSYCAKTEACVRDIDNPALWRCCSNEDVSGGLCCVSKDSQDGCCNSYGQCCPSNQPLMDKDGKCYSCNEEKGINVQGVESNCGVCENRTLSGSYCTSCKEGEFTDSNGNCKLCDDAGNYYTVATQTECAKCSNRTLGFNFGDKCMLNCDTPGTYTEGKPLPNIDGICYSCDYPESIGLGIWGDNSRCETLCPNRVLVGSSCMLNKCNTSDKPLLNSNNQCVPCDDPTALPKQAKCSTACNGIRENSGNYCVLKECPDGYFRDSSNNCKSCDDAGDYYTSATQTECAKCSNRTYGFNKNDKCMLNCDTPGTYTEGKPLPNIDGICYSCDYPESIGLGIWGDNSRCETLCPNRVLVGSSCMLNKCNTSDKPLLNSNNQCVPCDDPTALPKQAKCSTACNGIRENSGNYCVLKECPDGYFRDSSNNCKSCDDAGDYYTSATQTECAKCSNRTLGFNFGDKCMLNCNISGTYTEGKPLANIDGICYSCDYSGVINLGTWGDNSRCETLCPNREREGLSCVRKSCSNLNSLEDLSGECYPCNTTVTIPTTEDACKKCINRKYENGYCILS